MGIRIPRSGDQDVQNAFRDVEQEIEDLKAALASQGGSDPSGEIADLKKQVDLIPPARFDSDENVFVGAGPQHSVGLVPDPGETAGTSAFLREDSTWRDLVSGDVALEDNQSFLNVLPDEQQIDRGTDDIYQIPGSLHISGDVSAGAGTFGKLHAHDLTATPYGLVHRLHTNVDDVSTASAPEADLMTYLVPGGLLSTNGQVLRMTAWGSTENNATAKLITAYFGSTSFILAGSGALQNVAWRAVVDVVRTGDSTQVLSGVFTGYGLGSGTAFVQSSAEATPAETLANSIWFKLTGTGAVVTQKGMIIEMLS